MTVQLTTFPVSLVLMLSSPLSLCFPCNLSLMKNTNCKTSWFPKLIHKKMCVFLFGLLEQSLLIYALTEHSHNEMRALPKLHGKAICWHSGWQSQLISQVTFSINSQSWDWVIWYIQPQFQLGGDYKRNAEWLLPRGTKSVFRTVRGNIYL